MADNKGISTEAAPVDGNRRGSLRDNLYGDEAKRKASIAAMSQNLTGEIRNPLTNVPREQLMADVDDYANKNDLNDILPTLRKAALVAQNPVGFEEMPELDDNDKDRLRDEVTHRWRHPKML
jgi:hypothetical protein